MELEEKAQAKTIQRKPVRKEVEKFKGKIMLF